MMLSENSYPEKDKYRAILLIGGIPNKTNNTQNRSRSTDTGNKLMAARGEGVGVEKKKIEKRMEKRDIGGLGVSPH